MRWPPSGRLGQFEANGVRPEAEYVERTCLWYALVFRTVRNSQRTSEPPRCHWEASASRTSGALAVRSGPRSSTGL
jgi:hypothetical protein